MAFQSLRAVANTDTDVGVAMRSVGELGHLRMGELVTASNGKLRPTVTDGWIITCRDREIADVVAAHFNAQVTEFGGQGKSSDKWAVHTHSLTVPVRMGPTTNPDMMAGHECFGGRGMLRRCSAGTDGVRTCWTPVDGPAGRTEIAGDCVCERSLQSGGKPPEGGLCKPALRLSVFLDVPAIPVLGTFSFKSGSEQACMEMPAIVQMLVEAEVQQLMLPAQLRIDHRQSQGGSKKFAVPVLEVRLPQSTLLEIIERGRNELAAAPHAAAGELGMGDIQPAPEVDAATVAEWRATLGALTGADRDAAVDALRAIHVDLRHGVRERDRADVQAIVDTYTSHDEDDEIVDAELVYPPGEEPFEPMYGDTDE